MVVEPAGCRVFAIDRREERLEPRVMKVLVMLAGARGAVVSRDELIEGCWEGRIVSDDAINRVIGRLRRIGETIGGNAFRIETVPKVGYRLVGTVEPWVAPGPSGGPSILPDGEAVPPPLPVQRASRLGWRQPWVLAGSAAVALAAALLLMRPWEPRGQRLELGLFEAGEGLPPALATDLQSELAQSISCDCIEVAAVNGDASPRQYRVQGRVTKTATGLALLPELYAPGADRPFWRGRVEMAADGSDRKSQIEDLGVGISCIMGGARDDQMPLRGDALRHWAEFCVADDGLDRNSDALIARLEQLLRAEPRSALGWEALANQLLENASASDPRWRENALLPARAAVERAVALAPHRLGLLPAQASVTEPDAFAERERLLLKASTDKSDGYAQQALVHHFRAVGRIADARQAAALSVELQPWNSINRYLLYATQRLQGEFGAAAKTLAQLPDADDRTTGAVGLAIYKGDWREARRLAAETPDSPLGRALIRLFDALLAKDEAALRAAGDAMADLARDPATNDASVARMLAIAGRPDEALASIDRAIGPANYAAPMMELYSPAFAPVRATPGFWAMAERRGLLAYWRRNGPPDFCRRVDAPAPCAELVTPQAEAALRRP